MSLKSILKFQWIGIFFILFVNASYGQQTDDSLLFWNNNQRLTWNDFKGKIPDPPPLNDALSYVEIRTKIYKYQGVPQVEIKVMFNKCKSWCRNIKAAHLLNHEQLHFDISELYARKMRKAVAVLQKSGDQSVIDYRRLLDKLNEECSKTNRQYDRETAHGANQLKQEIWNKSIKKQLSSLKRYSISYSNR